METSELPEPSEDQVYNITFGMRYRNEEHPMGWHPDGWVTIIASTYERAREIAWQECAPWGFIYDRLDRESGRFNPELHPMGSLATFDGRKQ